MEEGILIEFTKGGGGSTKWGTEIDRFWGTIENKKSVTSYRCKSCGFLESYAK